MRQLSGWASRYREWSLKSWPAALDRGCWKNLLQALHNEGGLSTLLAGAMGKP